MSKACPLCGATKFADWRFGLLSCAQCDLVVAHSVWRPAANEQLNAAAFGDYEAVRSFWVRMFERLNNRRTMNRFRRAIQTGQLLEIGVGSGSFLVYAKIQGYSPLGIDLSAAICRRVKQNTGIPMHCGSVESLSDEPRFDVVVMNHVLEHVPYPVVLLKAVRARLKPGGLLHLAVPNVSSWEAWLPGWNSYEPYHLIYFTPKSLRRAVEKAGFEIQHLTTHESFSGWFLAILRTLLRKTHAEQPQQGRSIGAKPSSSFVEHAYRLLMVTWGLLTLPFRRLQQFLGNGDEVIIIARNGTLD